jgi:hypothetical protein
VRLERYAGLEAEILPRARKDFRLPPAIYAHSLKQYGVDIPPEIGEAVRAEFIPAEKSRAAALATLAATQRGDGPSDILICLDS